MHSSRVAGEPIWTYSQSFRCIKSHGILQNTPKQNLDRNHMMGIMEHWEHWTPSSEDERDVGELIGEISFVREYHTCPEIHEELTLLEMCSSYYKKSARWVRRRKQAVVEVQRFQSNGTTKEQYNKQQMMLKSSWRHLDELNPG